MVDVPGTAQPQAPAAPAAPGSPVEGQNQNGPAKEAGKGPAKPWMAQLKGHLQTHERLSQFDDFSSVAEEFLKFDGKRDRLVEIPGKEATDEQKGEFWKRLGRPEKADGYQFQKPQLPPGVTYNEASEAEFKKLAHSLNLTAEQAQKILEFDTTRTVGLLQRMQAQQEEGRKAIEKRDAEQRKALEQEWGTKAQENAAKAKQAFATFADKDLAALLQERGLADHPLVAKHFLGLASKIGETGFVRGGTPAAPGKGMLDLSKTFPAKE